MKKTVRATVVLTIALFLLGALAVPALAVSPSATDLTSVESAARFCLETAKTYGGGTASFYDEADFTRLTGRYGTMHHLQGMG